MQQRRETTTRRPPLAGDFFEDTSLTVLSSRERLYQAEPRHKVQSSQVKHGASEVESGSRCYGGHDVRSWPLPAKKGAHERSFEEHSVAVRGVRGEDASRRSARCVALREYVLRVRVWRTAHALGSTRRREIKKGRSRTLDTALPLRNRALRLGRTCPSRIQAPTQ